ncbi:MAG TPA: TetR/AcrR family transcriptional regulator [Thermoanaerobaculia bacterium]|nr:TetR/AcrR family transcriptional regulator [Thermoanaerobaculia bacterium]
MAIPQHEKSMVSVGRTLEAALELFSSQGFGGTSMRQIADEAGLSVGNVYHHFPSKDAIFQRLLDQYWERMLDPELRLNEVFARAAFPDDLEEMASAIEEAVEVSRPYILLIYVDVIEFRGEHIRTFYAGMAGRFEKAYGARLRERQQAGELGDVDPMVAVMVATRWFFYFFTDEKCFGAPMHFGRSPEEAISEFIQLLRYGLLPRDGGEPEGAEVGR